MIHIHTTSGCKACTIAIKALRASGIEFEEKGLGGLAKLGGLPILINTENGLRYNGWIGSIGKLKVKLKIKG